MKCEIGNSKSFQPVKVTFTLETREELNLLKCMFDPDVVWDDIDTTSVDTQLFQDVYDVLSKV